MRLLKTESYMNDLVNYVSNKKFCLKHSWEKNDMIYGITGSLHRVKTYNCMKNISFD